MREEIVRMFKAGVDVSNIADATGVPQPAVIAVLVRENLWQVTEGSSESNRVRATVRQGVVTAYRNYASVRETCDRLGISTREFWVIVTTEGEPKRSRKPFVRRLSRIRRDEEIIEMYKAGELIETICEVCGTDRPRLYRLLRREGIAPNRRG